MPFGKPSPAKPRKANCSICHELRTGYPFPRTYRGCGVWSEAAWICDGCIEWYVNQGRSASMNGQELKRTLGQYERPGIEAEFYRLMARVLVILIALLMQGNALAEGYNPASSGAVYSKYDAATIAANDKAIADSLNRLATQGGGELVISGSLALSQTIVVPPTVTFNKVAGFPVHLAIRGTIDAELVDMNGGIIVDWQPTLPPANLGGRDLRLALEHIGIRNGTVRVRPGTATQPGLGKYLTIRDVRIYGNTTGTCLDVSAFDGGHIENVNIHENPGCIGFSLVNSHQVHVDLTSRSNQIGAVVTGCGALFGALYCESNASFGLDANGLVRSNLTNWLENNNQNIAQGRRRLCWGNVFTGMEQVDSNQAWDDDVLSNICNFEASTLQGFQKMGDLINSATPGRNNWPANPSVTVNGNVLTIKQGAFDTAAKASQPCWVEMQPGGADYVGGNWSSGDVVVAYIGVQADANAKAWYAAHPGAELLFTTACISGTAPAISQRWSPCGDLPTCVALAACTGNGSNLRLFCFPAAGAASGPDQDLTFTIQAEIRKVSAP